MAFGEPLAHGWGQLDLVLGVVLGLIATSFILPPHTRRSAQDDTAIGVAFAAPGLLALVNGIAILARGPYDETWPPR